MEVHEISAIPVNNVLVVSGAELISVPDWSGEIIVKITMSGLQEEWDSLEISMWETQEEWDSLILTFAPLRENRRTLTIPLSQRIINRLSSVGIAQDEVEQIQRCYNDFFAT